MKMMLVKIPFAACYGVFGVASLDGAVDVGIREVVIGSCYGSYFGNPALTSNLLVCRYEAWQMIVVRTSEAMYQTHGQKSERRHTNFEF